MLIEELLVSNLVDKFEQVEILTGTTDRILISIFMSGGQFNNSNEEAEVVDRPYSYVYDWHYIYSAFLQQYNIDLFTTSMHWWKFKALFNCLQNTKFNDITNIRQTDTTKIKDSKERQHYLKLQEIYKLPNLESKKDLEDFNKLFE